MNRRANKALKVIFWLLSLSILLLIGVPRAFELWRSLYPEAVEHFDKEDQKKANRWFRRNVVELRETNLPIVHFQSSRFKTFLEAANPEIYLPLQESYEAGELEVKFYAGVPGGVENVGVASKNTVSFPAVSDLNLQAEITNLVSELNLSKGIRVEVDWAKRSCLYK